MASAESFEPNDADEGMKGLPMRLHGAVQGLEKRPVMHCIGANCVLGGRRKIVREASGLAPPHFNTEASPQEHGRQAGQTPRRKDPAEGDHGAQPSPRHLQAWPPLLASGGYQEPTCARPRGLDDVMPRAGEQPLRLGTNGGFVFDQEQAHRSGRLRR
jgi:hypothetical protein